MNAVVTAGGIPQPDEPLYAYTKGESKAMVDVAGKPMIQWTLDALSGAKNVDNIIITGLSPKSNLTCKKPIYYLSNQGKMLDNLVAGVNKSLELNPKNKHVLLVSSDIPALTAEMVDWLINTCMETNDDIYYGVCPREVMEARYPGSKRTYTHLKDMDMCGADINVAHVRMASEHLDVWDALITRRKSPLALASVMGLGVSISYITRQLTIAEAIDRITKRVGITGRAIVWNHAEPCMDVDKPNQLEMMRADLAKRARPAPRKSPAKKSVAPAKKQSAAKKKAVAKKSAPKPKAKKK
ncbi:MAG: nucleotidyltransferase family protein [Anaerolineales bacterium]